MKVGTIALECNAIVSDDKVVVPRAEIGAVEGQLQRLSVLIARYGLDTTGAAMNLGPICTFSDKCVEFDVLCTADAGDVRFDLAQFIAWGETLGADAPLGNPVGFEAKAMEEDGRVVLTRLEAKRLFTLFKPSSTELVDDIVECISEAVKVTTTSDTYVVIGASIDDYVPNSRTSRPLGDPWGQLPLLPNVES